MSKNRYEYSWNEFDCVEKVIDTQTHKVYHGCEIAVKLLNKQHKRIAELERQLADKEKLINDYADEHAMLQYKIADLAVKEIKAEDFAIEQLEKVKKFVIRQLFIITKDCSDLDEAEAKGCNELREEIIKEIDNQIQELRGEE